MDGSPMLFDLPPVRSSRAASRSPASGTTRKQPIRDAIMAYLTEARSAKQIAEHIERKVSITTGHLRAMGIRGSSFVSAGDSTSGPIGVTPRRTRQPSPGRTPLWVWSDFTRPKPEAWNIFSVSPAGRQPGYFTL